MKKMFFCAILSAFCTIISAEDLIVTISDKSIKAKIEEVSDTEVRYKEIDNVDGPTFVLKTSEISTIVFSNGSVKNFHSQSAAKTSKVVEESPEVVAETPLVLSPIKKVGGHYEYQGRIVKESEVLEVMQNNCSQAYELFDKGRNMLVAGLTLDVCATGILVASFFIDDPVQKLGILCGVCLPSLIVSLPLVISGSRKKGKAVGVYNQSCAKTTTSELSFNVKTDGISLCYNF